LCTFAASRVSTVGLLLRTRETVVVETRAFRATSEIVATASEPSLLNKHAETCLATSR
jgi:hypothetical protein